MVKIKLQPKIPGSKSTAREFKVGKKTFIVFGKSTKEARKIIKKRIENGNS